MKIERLSETEAEIMRLFWEQKAPLCVSEVTRLLSHKHNWKAPTTHVLLMRMVAKGVLSVDKSGYTHKYTPTLTEDEWLVAESTQVSERLKRSLPSIVATLIESQQLSEKELDEISKLLAEKRRKLKG